MEENNIVHGNLSASNVFMFPDNNLVKSKVGSYGVLEALVRYASAS